MNISRLLLYSFTVLCVFAMGGLFVTILAPHSSNSKQLPGGHESRKSAAPTADIEESLTSIARHEQPSVTATSRIAASEPEKSNNRATQLTNLDSLKNPAKHSSADNGTEPGLPDVAASISHGQDIFDAAEFLGHYDRLREAPQLALLKYAGKKNVKWRCIVHGTSGTGLGYILAHLPNSTPQELELMLWLDDPNGVGSAMANKFAEIFTEHRAYGVPAEIEVTIDGHITAFVAAGLNEGAARLNLAGVKLTPAQAIRDATTPLPADENSALNFLRDFRSVDRDDPDGIQWLNSQLQLAGYTSGARSGQVSSNDIRWRCELHEYRPSTGRFKGTIIGGAADSPEVSVSLRSVPTERRIAESARFPLEVSVQGSFSSILFQGNPCVSIVDAELFHPLTGSRL